MKFVAFLVVLLIGGLLFATKPTQQDAERMFIDQIRTEISTLQVNTSTRSSDEAAANLLISACKVFEATCAEAFHRLMTSEYDDYALFAVYRVGAAGEVFGECVAVLDQLLCFDTEA